MSADRLVITEEVLPVQEVHGLVFMAVAPLMLELAEQHCLIV
jgi:hypothetical protein